MVIAEEQCGSNVKRCRNGWPLRAQEKQHAQIGAAFDARVCKKAANHYLITGVLSIELIRFVEDPHSIYLLWHPRSMNPNPWSCLIKRLITSMFNSDWITVREVSVRYLITEEINHAQEPLGMLRCLLAGRKIILCAPSIIWVYG